MDHLLVQHAVRETWEGSFKFIQIKAEIVIVQASRGQKYFHRLEQSQILNVKLNNSKSATNSRRGEARWHQKKAFGAVVNEGAYISTTMNNDLEQKGRVEEELENMQENWQNQ